VSRRAGPGGRGRFLDLDAVNDVGTGPAFGRPENDGGPAPGTGKAAAGESLCRPDRRESTGRGLGEHGDDAGRVVACDRIGSQPWARRNAHTWMLPGVWTFT
jgi:hypothetical protein